jgi:hypothetical protein
VTTARDLARIVEGPGTKADRARALFDLGCDRTDVVELLGMSYSQAHSIYKGMQGGNHQAATARRVDNLRHTGRTQPPTDLEPGLSNSQSRSRPTGWQLHLSPTQTRRLTHNGHVVIRVDKDSGPVCRACGQRLTFSLQWLGFLHSDSQADPTHLEDCYQ